MFTWVLGKVAAIEREKQGIYNPVGDGTGKLAKKRNGTRACGGRSKKKLQDDTRKEKKCSERLEGICCWGKEMEQVGLEPVTPPPDGRRGSKKRDSVKTCTRRDEVTGAPAVEKEDVKKKKRRHERTQRIGGTGVSRNVGQEKRLKGKPWRGEKREKKRLRSPRRTQGGNLRSHLCSPTGCKGDWGNVVSRITLPGEVCE